MVHKVLESLLARSYTYLPVGPRLIRLFGTHNLAKIIQAHGLRCCNDGLCTISMILHLGNLLILRSTGMFSSDCCGISFALNMDRVNPYSQNRVSYSMWPIVLTLKLTKKGSMYFRKSLVSGYCSW